MIFLILVFLTVVGATHPGAIQPDRSEIQELYNKCWKRHNILKLPDYRLITVNICGPGTTWWRTVCIPKLSVDQQTIQPSRIKIKKIYNYNNVQCSNIDTLYVCGPGTTWDNKCILDCIHPNCELSLFELLILGIVTAHFDTNIDTNTQIEEIKQNIVQLYNCQATSCELSLFERLIMEIVTAQLDITIQIDETTHIDTLKQNIMNMYDCTDETCMNKMLYAIIKLYEAAVKNIHDSRHRLRLRGTYATLIETYDIVFQLLVTVTEDQLYDGSTLENTLQKIGLALCSEQHEDCTQLLEKVQVTIIRIVTEEPVTQNFLDRIKDTAAALITDNGLCVDSSDYYMFGIISTCTEQCVDCTKQCVKWSGRMIDGFIDSLGYTDIRGGCAYIPVDNTQLCDTLLWDMPIISNKCCELGKGGRQCW